MTPRPDHRPKLTRHISIADFLDFYWLKKKLQQFCRDQGLPTDGSKQMLQKRIKRFLRTGDRDSFLATPSK